MIISGSGSLTSVVSERGSTVLIKSPSTNLSHIPKQCFWGVNLQKSQQWIIKAAMRVVENFVKSKFGGDEFWTHGVITFIGLLQLISHPHFQGSFLREKEKGPQNKTCSEDNKTMHNESIPGMLYCGQSESRLIGATISHLTGADPGFFQTGGCKFKTTCYAMWWKSNRHKESDKSRNFPKGGLQPPQPFPSIHPCIIGHK